MLARVEPARRRARPRRRLRHRPGLVRRGRSRRRRRAGCSASTFPARWSTRRDAAPMRSASATPPSRAWTPRRSTLADADLRRRRSARLGLMYVPDPALAVRELRRVVRPGGRIGLAVWGERSRCGWAAVFPIVDAEVASDVCPLFFGLGSGRCAGPRLCGDAGLARRRAAPHRDHAGLRRRRRSLRRRFRRRAGRAGLVALRRVRRASAFARSYLAAISSWRQSDGGYRVPGEFVVVVATRA